MCLPTYWDQARWGRPDVIVWPCCGGQASAALSALGGGAGARRHGSLQHEELDTQHKAKGAHFRVRAGSIAGVGLSGRPRDKIRLLGFTTLHDSRRYAIPRCLDPSHPDTKARCTGDGEYAPINLGTRPGRRCWTAVRNRRSRPRRAPPKGISLSLSIYLSLGRPRRIHVPYSLLSCKRQCHGACSTHRTAKHTV
jgi:hypothetical protein